MKKKKHAALLVSMIMLIDVPAQGVDSNSYEADSAKQFTMNDLPFLKERSGYNVGDIDS